MQGASFTSAREEIWCPQQREMPKIRRKRPETMHFVLEIRLAMTPFYLDYSELERLP